MKQQSFSDYEYENRRRKTKRDLFLSTMEEIIPWEEWLEMIRPHYPSGKRGRKPKDPETMLRMYLLQNWYLMSSEGIEDAIYDSYAMRNFMKIDFFEEQVPDETTLRRFRQMLEKQGIDVRIRNDLSERLAAKGLLLLSGGLTDAQVIATPAAVKATEETDP